MQMPYRLSKYRWIPPPIRQLGFHVGRRGMMLLFFGFLFCALGYGWMTREPLDVRNYAIMTELAPLSTWGAIQLSVGLFMCLASVWKRIESWAFALSAAFYTFIGAATAILFWPGQPDPGATALRAISIYLFYSIFILIVSGWPESTTVVVVQQQDKDRDAD